MKKANEELIIPEIFPVGHKDLLKIIFIVQSKKYIYSKTSTDSL